MVADHGHARARRRDDGVEGVVAEHAHEALEKRQRLVAVTRVGVHLTAAGLLLGEQHRVAEALEDLDRGPAGLGKQGVVHAGDEQGDPHDGHASASQGSRSGGAPIRRAARAGELLHGIAERLKLLVGELDLGRGEVVLEMGDRRGARDRQHHRRALEQPGQRQL